MKEISSTLIDWYKKNKRDLPWRHTKDAYAIWLSEIILQQTQVIQGLSYYLKFIEHYPSVRHLAKAPEDEIMKHWQGLGYYSRARNLHAAAKQIVSDHKGTFPKTYDDIRKLKGVGDYTSAAIASFAYDLPHAVVDGNVYRVLSRLFGIETPINSIKGKKEFQALADQLLNKKQAALHNSALMEFGALHCRPKNPDCPNCPLSSFCFAFQKKLVNQFPVKEKKAITKDRYLNYLVLLYRDQVYIRKRTDKDIWQNLYEFYLIESQKRISEKQLLKLDEIKELPKFEIHQVSHEQKHILSHRHLWIKFYVLKLNIKPKHLKFIKISQLKKFAFPKPMENFIKNHPDWLN